MQSIEILLQQWKKVNESEPGKYHDFEEFCKSMTMIVPAVSHPINIGLTSTVTDKSTLSEVEPLGLLSQNPGSTSSVIDKSVSSEAEPITETIETPAKSIKITPEVIDTCDFQRCNKISDKCAKLLNWYTETHSSVICKVLDGFDPNIHATTDELAQKYRSVLVLLTVPFDIKMLADKISFVTKSLLDVSNLAIFWNAALDLHDDEVNDICLKFFCKNVKDIQSNDSVVQQLHPLVISFITKSEDTSIEEIDLFHFVHHWHKLARPWEIVINDIINDLRLPLLNPKELVSIFAPYRFVHEKNYLEALEFAANPSSKDATEKKYTPRLGQSLDFYFYYNDKPCAGFRIITSEDITPIFVSRLKKYVEKNGGITALDDFGTKGISRHIRTDKHTLKIDFNLKNISENFYIDCHSAAYTKNSICSIYGYSTANKLSTLENITLDSKLDDEEKRGIAIYVKNGIKF